MSSVLIWAHSFFFWGGVNKSNVTSFKKQLAIFSKIAVSSHLPPLKLDLVLTFLSPTHRCVKCTNAIGNCRGRTHYKRSKKTPQKAAELICHPYKQQSTKILKIQYFFQTLSRKCRSRSSLMLNLPGCIVPTLYKKPGCKHFFEFCKVN